MHTQSELAIVRAAYAKQILAAAGVADARLAQAFAAIPARTLSAQARGW